MSLKFAVCEGINPLPYNPRLIISLEKKALENIMRKGENASCQYYLQCFPLFPTQISIFESL